MLLYNDLECKQLAARDTDAVALPRMGNKVLCHFLSACLELRRKKKLLNMEVKIKSFI
jgi:hypothetical protein